MSLSFEVSIHECFIRRDLMKQQQNTKRNHRVPIGFGPAPSPRQDPNGEPFQWKDSEATTVGVTYASEHAYLNSLLPEGYETDPSTEAIVMFEVMELRNLPWLNGRGYNTWGVYIANVICSRYISAGDWPHTS